MNTATPSIWRRTRFLVVYFGGVVAVFATWLAAEWWTSLGKMPPSSVATLNDYLTWQPNADQFVQLSVKPPHLMALGPHVGLVPSGASAHVFDASGTLMDSTRDIGDDPAFKQRWKLNYPLSIQNRGIAESW